MGKGCSWFLSQIMKPNFAFHNPNFAFMDLENACPSGRNMEKKPGPWSKNPCKVISDWESPLLITHNIYSSITYESF